MRTWLKYGKGEMAQRMGILEPEGKNAFREVAKQGSLSGHLDEHFSDLNRIM